MENQTTENMPKYGEMLAQRIRENFSENSSYKPSDFERFVLSRGFLFETDEALKAGYDRYWKSGRKILTQSDLFGTDKDSEATVSACEIITMFAELHSLSYDKAAKWLNDEKDGVKV